MSLRPNDFHREIFSRQERGTRVSPPLSLSFFLSAFEFAPMPNSSRVPALARKASRLFETRRLEARVFGSCVPHPPDALIGALPPSFDARSSSISRSLSSRVLSTHKCHFQSERHFTRVHFVIVSSCLSPEIRLASRSFFL